MWLKLHLPRLDNNGPSILVNMDRVQEIAVPTEQTGSVLIFGIKPDGSADQTSVVESQKTIARMLGAQLRMTPKDDDARFVEKWASTIKAAATPPGPND